jgi:hypothetical protein
MAQPIKLAPGKNLIPWALQVKAVHILVGESQAVKARDLYNTVFGSRNVGGYPQGLQMRLVPDISDSRFPVTKNTRIKAIKMMAKQKVFQENTKVIHTTQEEEEPDCLEPTRLKPHYSNTKRKRFGEAWTDLMPRVNITVN